VVADEALPQIPVLISTFGVDDARQRHLFDEDMGRQDHNRLHLARAGPGMDQRDRRAVAVPDQDRSFERKPIEQRR
jgi:hypothetical protein